MSVQVQNPTAAPTEKQISYAVSLYRSLYDPAGVDENIEEAVLALCEGLYDGTRAEASAAIDSLKALLAVKQAEQATAHAAAVRSAEVFVAAVVGAPTAAAAHEIVQAHTAAAMSVGMYRTPAGDIVKVQANRQNGNLYGKTLTPIGGKRLTEADEVVGFEFVYSGSIRNLTPAMRMTLDEAIAFGIRYGVCCNCGASLKDAKSVAAGIGPVCSKRFA